jgi:pyridinium-3,5-bisthiocarboxylic acid mononucleotide nickel chelatase
LLPGSPIYSEGVATELTTPTGALLVTAYAGSFGPMPPMRVTAVGYGAGDKDLPERPNVLRLLVGDADHDGETERIVSIQCEMDDMNPQLFGPLMDQLYAAGALEVFYAPVQMKKNRPGTLVTVLAPPDRRSEISGVLFRETTTIGVRYQELQRERLERQISTIQTPVGPIRFKIARRGGAIVNAAPEFEDCARAAAEQGLPIKDVQARAIKAWMDRGA